MTTKWLKVVLPQPFCLCHLQRLHFANQRFYMPDIFKNPFVLLPSSCPVSPTKKRRGGKNSKPVDYCSKGSCHFVTFPLNLGLIRWKIVCVCVYVSVCVDVWATVSSWTKDLHLHVLKWGHQKHLHDRLSALVFYENSQFPISVFYIYIINVCLYAVVCVCVWERINVNV